MMKLMKKSIKRVLSLSVATSLVVSLQPMMPTGQRTTAPLGSAVAEASSKAADIGTETPSVISEINDGGASQYGLQNVKYVDENGKEVDIDELTGSEQSVYDGSLLERIRQDNVTVPTGKLRKAASVLSADSSYTSPYVAAKARDQGSWGVCWAFGATAAIEANIVKNASKYSRVSYTRDNIDLSERHVAWFAHNTYSTDKNDISYGDGAKKTSPKAAYTGGNREQVMAYLARSSGMALEKEAPYDTSSSMQGLSEEQRYSSVAQLHDANLLGEYKPDTDHIDLVKGMVQSYGAAMVSYFSSDGYYGKDSNGEKNYYYPSGKGSNHAVCIVGWDDTYAASSFKNTPSGDGAWLVRNSWGAGWGDNGCFWMSYYEPTICSIAAYNMVDTKDYGRTYQYTGGADIQWMSMSGSSIQGANVYCAKDNETLKSVGLITSANSMKVEAEIYVSNQPMQTSPTEGTNVSSVSSDNVGMAGFHMLDLTQPVSLEQGQYFSVIMKVTNTTGGASCLVTESNKSNAEKKGQTFYYIGNRWTDTTDKSMKNFKNACIYAYTSGASDEKANLDQLIAQIEALNRNDLQPAPSQEQWDSMQEDIKYAKTCSNPAEVKRAWRILMQSVSQIASRNLTISAQGNEGPGMNGVEIYANGGSVKENGVKKNYKTATLYHHIQRTESLLWKNKKKGELKYGYKGKYVAVATTEYRKPELNTNGTVKSVDEKANEIVKVSASTTKLTIQPKAEGDIYVWVLYYPQSDYDQEAILQKQLDYAVTKVHVSTAPKTVKLYNNASADPAANDTMYTSSVLPAGEGVDVYVKGIIGSITKKANTVKLIEDETIRYNPIVPAKYEKYVTVKEQTDSKHHFRIDVNPNILTECKVKEGKTLAVTVAFQCNRNTSKGNFKLVIGNPVKTMNLSAMDSSTNLTTENGIVDVKLPSAATAAQTVLLQEGQDLIDFTKQCTDATKFYKLSGADQYSFTATGGIQIVGKPDKDQAKVSVAAVKNTNQYKITAAKKTPDGTVAYLMIFHNAYQRTSGTGFQIIRVTVG